VEAYGDAWTDPEHIVTNGAFKIESYIPWESMSLVRNPTFHGRSSGNLERVEMHLSRGNPPEELELYENDGVDVVEIREAIYHARYTYAEKYLSEPRQSLYYVGFDTSRPPFDDPMVRRAFAMAVDKERLAYEVLDGAMSPATGGFVPPTIHGHSPGIGLPYDPSQARQLMAQAGYPDGHGFPTLGIIWHQRLSDMLKHLKSHWNGDLNVEVAIEITDWEDVIRTYLSRNANFMGYLADYPDPDSFLRAGIGHVLARWKNDQYDQLVEEAQRTFDQGDRIRLYQEADKILIEEAAVIPIVYIQKHYLIKPWVKIPKRGYEARYIKDIILEPH